MIEKGAASILIELKDGTITVYHGEDSTKLARLINAPEGTWSELWRKLEELGIYPLLEEGIKKQRGGL